MKEVEAEDVLAAMLALFADGENWTRGTAARDQQGRAVDEMDPHARSFCLLGARDRLWRETGFGSELMYEIEHRLQRATGEASIPFFNDCAPNFGVVRAAILAAMQDGK